MENCLVTKLKAVVNNPNLPVLETMQQFTLDAIAASGNASMTNSQKWALNHFFYQIGAIDNSGIFAKTKYLFLPMICNEDKDKLLVNYKDNVAFTVSSSVKGKLAFDANGCPYNTSTSRTTQELTSAENTDCSDIYFADGFPGMLSDGNIGAFRSGYSVYGLTQDETYYTTLMQGISQKSTKSTIDALYGHVGTTYEGEYSDLKVGRSQNFPSTSTAGTENKPTAPFSLNVQFGNPCGLIMWGSHLTEQETTTLANAIRELMFSYCGL